MRQKYQRTYPRNADDSDVRYIVEKRGGWDEWSEPYLAPVSVLLPGGREISRSGKIKDVFISGDGRDLVVEFPLRIDDDISVECYEPEYSYERYSLSDFNKAIEQGGIQVNV